MTLSRIDSIIQFTENASVTWDSIEEPVPSGVVVIDTDNKVIKEGDGVTLFNDLPTCLDYDGHTNISQAIIPTSNDVGMVSVCENGDYAISDTNLTTLIELISTTLSSKEDQKDLTDIISSIDLKITDVQSTSNGIVVICKNGKYISSGKTLQELATTSSDSDVTLMHIEDIEFYTDANLVNRLNYGDNLKDNNTYYAKVKGFHDRVENDSISFGLSSSNENVEISSDNNEILKVIVAKYDSTQYTNFTCCVTDADGYIYAAGYTYTSTSNSYDALIVKFDKDLNVIVSYTYGGSYNDYFYDICLNSLGDVYAVGHTYSYDTGTPTYSNGLVVRTNSSLMKISAYVLTGTYDIKIRGIVIDPDDIVYVMGVTYCEGTGYPTYSNVLVVKLPIDLASITLAKTFSGDVDDNKWDMALCGTDQNKLVLVGTKTGTIGSMDCSIITLTTV